MHEPQPKRRQLRLSWIIAAVFFLFCGWFIYQLFGPDPKIILSKETTFITEPLKPDGLPDYEAYWNLQASEGVTPENNAAPLLWKALWPGGLDEIYWLPLCEALGMEQVPSQGEALVEPYDESVLEQIAAELLKKSPDPDAPDSTTGDAQAAEDEDNFGGEYGGFGETEYDYASRLRDETAYEVVDRADSRPWTSEQLPALANWVEQNRQPLDLIVAASERPRYYSPPPTSLDNNDNMLISMLLPDIQMMRSAARSLPIRAMQHLGENRPMDAWQDLLACHRLARLTAENNTLVGQLVAIAIDGIACDRTNTLLHHGELSSDELRQILTDLNALGPSSFCARAMDQGERLSYLDVALNLAKGNTDVTGLLGVPTQPIRALSYARVDWNEILRMGNRWYDKLVVAAGMPDRDQRVEALGQFEDELWEVSKSTQAPSAIIGGVVSPSRRSELFGNVMLSMMLPATQAARDAEDRNNTLFDLTKLAAALAVYRAEQGKYPEQLEDLVPSVLDKLPVDMYSGQSFLYSRQGEGYLLYSVFQNKVDDGGDSIDGMIVDGEWVDEKSEDFDYGNSDIVIRVPRPKFELPKPPAADDIERAFYGE